MSNEVLYDTADKMLDALAPHRKAWAPEPRDWLFRGQRDASWPLMPSVFRAETLTTRFGLPAPATASERIALESRLLRRFAALADVQGLPTLVEPDECELRTGERWMPARLYPHAALAQHYGVPTRLLDWTRRPLVAAWFAAEGAAREAPPGSAPSTARLAVWALRRTVDRKEDLLSKHGIRVIRAPRASNRNLHLQSGLFTITESDGPLVLPDSGILVRHTLPVSQAPRLLWLLAANFVQGATVYAGYEGVTRSLEEEHLRKR